MDVEGAPRGEEEGDGEAQGESGLHRGRAAGHQETGAVGDHQAGDREQADIEHQEEQAEDGGFDVKA